MIGVEDVDVTLDGKPILREIDLDVRAGETVALLGPSGSGKTTLLRVVAGLQRPDRGRVLLDGADVTGVPAHRRGIGLVFQDAVLFPHRDVGRNIAFGVPGLTRGETARRVAEMLELVGLQGFERRPVGTLSGGEAQRVALARALAPSPRVLLLDEPLGSLDGPLRDRLQDDLRLLFGRLSLTVLYVTHDVGEAFTLGRRVAVLRDGRIAHVAAPEELWRHPRDEWVARFLGMRNVLEDDGRLVVVRPEAVRVTPGEGAVVVAAERHGPAVVLTVRRDDGQELDAATTELDPPRPGDRVSVALDPAGVVELTRGGGTR
jgi:thiamine transport system ATP-binding protein